MECFGIDPLCGAHPIQVGGDASEVHGPAGACDHAEVDVLSGRSHVVFQHETDFLSERVLHADQRPWTGLGSPRMGSRSRALGDLVDQPDRSTCLECVDVLDRVLVEDLVQVAGDVSDVSCEQCIG